MRTLSRMGALLGACLTMLVGVVAVSANPKSVGYERRWVAGTGAQVITVDLNDPEVVVSVVVARNGIGTAESFSSMIHRTMPDAAVTGTFFGVKGLLPIGHLASGGHLLYPMATGTTLVITRDNRALLVPTTADKELDWSQYPTAIFAGPRLLRGGAYAVAPRAEGFTDSGHYRLARRTAVGITAKNKLLLVVVSRNISLSRMAKVMKGLGARDAVALDGGSSAAMYYRGSTIIRPARSLTNIIAVYATGGTKIIAGAPSTPGG